MISGALGDDEARRRARDLRTADASPAPAIDLDPVVVATMTDAANMINHNNALVGTNDKAWMVLTLQLLVRGGHRFDVEELCAWAAGHGFTPTEVKNLREYATKVLAGRSFPLGSTYGPGPAALDRWREAC